MSMGSSPKNFIGGHKVTMGGKVGGPDDPCVDALTRLRRKLEAEGKSFQDMIEEHLEKTKNDPPPAQGNIIKKPL